MTTPAPSPPPHGSHPIPEPRSPDAAPTIQHPRLNTKGLRVAITGFIGDVNRTRTRTRCCLARRVGGSPADMGWESQAVLLVPPARLGEYLTGP